MTCISPHPRVELDRHYPGMDELFSKVLEIPKDLSPIQPNVVPASDFAKLPVYHIRTRVVIERLSIEKNTEETVFVF